MKANDLYEKRSGHIRTLLEYVKLIKDCDDQLMVISCNMHIQAIKQRFVTLIEENNLSSAFIDLVETLEIDNSDGRCYNRNNNIESEHRDHDCMATNINIKLGEKCVINFYYCFHRACHENMPWYNTYVSHNHDVIFENNEKFCRRTITNGYRPNSSTDPEILRYIDTYRRKHLERLHQIILETYNVTIVDLYKFLNLLALQFADVIDKLHLTFSMDDLYDEYTNFEPSLYENKKHKYEETV